MTPYQLAKSNSEHAHQVASFAYFNVAEHHGFDNADEWAETGIYSKKTQFPIPELKWIHAVHNQGHGDAIRGAHAKAEGVKKGVGDIFWPYTVPMMHLRFGISSGLYIEMKKPDKKSKTGRGKGSMSDEQIEFKEYVESQGYCFETCYSWIEAVEVVKKYYRGEL